MRLWGDSALLLALPKTGVCTFFVWTLTCNFQWQVGPAEYRTDERGRNQGNSGLAITETVKPMGLFFHRADTILPIPTFERAA